MPAFAASARMNAKRTRRTGRARRAMLFMVELLSFSRASSDGGMGVWVGKANASSHKRCSDCEIKCRFSMLIEKIPVLQLLQCSGYSKPLSFIVRVCFLALSFFRFQGRRSFSCAFVMCPFGSCVSFLRYLFF